MQLERSRSKGGFRERHRLFRHGAFLAAGGLRLPMCTTGLTWFLSDMPCLQTPLHEAHSAPRNPDWSPPLKWSDLNYVF